MRLFFLEDSVDYGRYRFSYRPFAELETLDELPAIYARGFLPYSAEPSEPRHLFYLGRSLRYQLAAFELDKKRRYDFRQVEAREPLFAVQPLAICLPLLPSDWTATLNAWMNQRFAAAYLSAERLHYIVRKPFSSHLAVARLEGRPFAYALLVRRGPAVHYWFAFYDAERFPGLAIGKWLLASTAYWARDSGSAQFYVGTGYGAKASYKTQGVRGAEFFDGSAWNPDLAELKRRQTGDP